MSQIVFYILLGLFSPISLSFVLLSFLRYNNKIIFSRTPFHLLAVLASMSILLMAIVSLSGTFSIAQALTVFYSLFSALAATYVARIMLVLNDYRYNWFKRTASRFACGVGAFFFCISICAAPVFYFLSVRTANIIVMEVFSGVMMAIYFFILVFGGVVFYYVGRDSYKVKEEVFTVSTLGFIMWVGTFIYVKLNGFVVIHNLMVYFSLVTVLSLSIFYFNCALPVICSFRSSKNDNIYKRSRYISNMLIESEESFDEELLSSNQCLEAILFFKEVQAMVLKKDWKKDEFFEKVDSIYKQFLSDRANFDITVPQSIVKKIEEKLNEEKIDSDIFEDALDYVWNNIILPCTEHNSAQNAKACDKRRIGNGISRFALWK